MWHEQAGAAGAVGKFLQLVRDGAARSRAGPVQGERSRPRVPTRDPDLPRVTSLPVKPALSSEHPFNARLRTYDDVLGTVPSAWDMTTNRTEVPALKGPTSSRGGTDNKQQTQHTGKVRGASAGEGVTETTARRVRSTRRGNWGPA